MTDDTLSLAAGPYITGFVGGAIPSPISDADVATMLGNKASEPEPESGRSYQVGAQVRIIDGPFAHFIGVIDRVNAPESTLVVRAEIFGRVTPMEVGFDQVAKP